MLEPRVTLLDALRNYSSLTGAKEGCDRASCGACTVLMDGLPIYSRQKLAIEAQGHHLATVEGLARDGKLSKVQEAFIEKDALQCGYCTPGFIMSVNGVIGKFASHTRRNPAWLSGKLVPLRYSSSSILLAALKASGKDIESKTEVLNG